MKDYVGKKISANCFVGLEAVGGKIHFDDSGLTFKAHSLNIQKDEIRIEYADILSVDKCNTLNIAPNGIIIFTKDDFEYRFVINNRKSVIEYLNSMLIEK